MKFILPLVFIIFLISACSSTEKMPSNIVQFKNDVYISSAGSVVAYQKAFNKAINDASSFCVSSGKKSEVVEVVDPKSNIYEVMIYFKCI